MNHGSLFSGGGGFDLAAEQVGWQNIFHCEKDVFCQTILKHYWPESQCYSDIKEFDARPYRGTVDVLTGGFPCQPFSTAGKRLGTEDDRYLWPQMLRVIEELQAPWVVGENVYGLVNWNEGLVFDQVLSDLEAQGYEVTAFLLPAAGVNAPHQRYRIWIVGYNPVFAALRQEKADTDTGSTRRGRSRSRRVSSQGRDSRQRKHIVSLRSPELEKADSYADSNGSHGLYCKDEEQPGERGEYAQCNVEPLGSIAANAGRQRCEGQTAEQEPEGQRFECHRAASGWSNWPTQSPLCSGDDGLPRELDGIAFSKWREQSVKMFGNAIVPQVAVQIFSAINQFEADNKEQQ